jgi:hypothetical protein
MSEQYTPGELAYRDQLMMEIQDLLKDLEKTLEE